MKCLLCIQTMKRVLRVLKRIPERHYWPIFIILSLYFIVPMSEITVTVAALLYFKYEKFFRSVIGRLTSRVPDWLRYGGSILFFLVMIDDTLFYVTFIVLAFWSTRMVNKKSGTPPSQGDDEVLQLEDKQQTHETNSNP